MKVCANTGCPNLTTGLNNKCDQHQAAANRQRGTTTQRGYGTEHQRMRANYAQHMATHSNAICWRCNGDLGTNWQLGHCDNDRNTYHGPECATCNQATNATGRGPGRCPHPSHATTQ